MDWTLTLTWTPPSPDTRRLPPAKHRFDPAVEEASGGLERRIRMREVRLIVYRNWVTTPPFARWDVSLRDGAYRLVSTVQTARIYRR